MTIPGSEDEIWLANFIARHPVISRKALPSRAAAVLLHDAKVLQPDLVERFSEALVRQNITRLIAAVQSSDQRTVRRLLKGLSPAHAQRLIAAIRSAMEKGGIG